ncbi:MAG: Na+/H+ antiporter subunit E [Acidimicrobiales bacterium]
MMRRLLLGAALLVTWLLLWGEVSVANLLSGLVASAAVVVLVPGLGVPAGHRVRPVGLVCLVGLFVVALARSTYQVVLAVVHPTPERLRAGVVRVRLRSRSPLVGTIVADLVTLTPGTLSLSLDNGVLFVHVLGLGDPEAARADVLRFEQAVLAAIEPLPPAVSR